LREQLFLRQIQRTQRTTLSLVLTGVFKESSVMLAPAQRFALSRAP
jgi:hypothetical protein